MSNKLIEDIAKVVKADSKLTLKRKLKIKIEIEGPNGETISIADHPANVHIEVWDGKSYQIFDPNKRGTRPCQKHETIQYTHRGTQYYSAWTATYKAEKVIKKLIYKDNIDSIKWDRGLFIINDWIALKVA